MKQLILALITIASMSQAHAGNVMAQVEKVNPHVLITTTPDGKQHHGTMFLFLSECNKEQQRLAKIEAKRFAHDRNVKKMTRYNCLQK